jgi:hypothetical protein
MFMAVRVRSGQFMMDVLRNGKRCESQEKNNKAD